MLHWLGRPAGADAPAAALLTWREKDCLAHLEAGWTTAETAAALGISRSTLNAHLTSARQKLGVRNTAQALVTLARSHERPDQKPMIHGGFTQGQIALVDRLSRATSFPEAFRMLHDYAAPFGIKAITEWVVADPVFRIDDRNGFIYLSLPDEFIRLYQASGGLAADPTAETWKIAVGVLKSEFEETDLATEVVISR